MDDIRLRQKLQLPEPINPNFHPSHTRVIKLKDSDTGLWEVVPLNRSERRKLKIYNKDLVHHGNGS